MRVLSACRKQGWKAVLTVVAFLASPVLAQEARPSGSLLVELQPPALDASLYGLRLEITPSPEVPFSFGLVQRGGGWGRAFGAKARFDGTSAGEVKLNFGVGGTARYAPFSFAGGALRPFLGMTVGLEEFAFRTGPDSFERSSSLVYFFEPAVGVMYRPGAGRVGLTARVGPGFASSQEPEPAVGSGHLSLRSVYPAASVGLLFVLL